MYFAGLVVLGCPLFHFVRFLSVDVCCPESPIRASSIRVQHLDSCEKAVIVAIQKNKTKKVSRRVWHKVNVYSSNSQPSDVAAFLVWCPTHPAHPLPVNDVSRFLVCSKFICRAMKSAQGVQGRLRAGVRGARASLSGAGGEGKAWVQRFLNVMVVARRLCGCSRLVCGVACVSCHTHPSPPQKKT